MLQLLASLLLYTNVILMASHS